MLPDQVDLFRPDTFEDLRVLLSTILILATLGGAIYAHLCHHIIPYWGTLATGGFCTSLLDDCLDLRTNMGSMAAPVRIESASDTQHFGLLQAF